MKRFLLRLLAFAVIAGAIGAALWPVGVDQYQLWQSARKVLHYRQFAQNLDTLACGTLLARAREYNDSLEAVGLRDAFAPDDPGRGDEPYMLELNADGVMAVLSIPKLGETMPVYHEYADDAQQTDVSHLAGTSLPVGGDGTCCVIYGQRRGRFADLDRLIPGDCFYVEAIQDTLVYEVEQVLTLEGEAVSTQELDPEADTCALMTTASRDGEALRLLVRGKRVSRREAPLADDSQLLPDWAARGIIAAPVLLAGLILMAVVEALRRGARRRKLKRVRL